MADDVYYPPKNYQPATAKDTSIYDWMKTDPRTAGNYDTFLKTISPGTDRRTTMATTNPLGNFLNSPYRTAPVNANVGATTPTGYPGAPLPTNWDPTYGGIPGTVQIPSPSQDLSSVLPGLSGLNTQASNALLAELTGQLSPQTQALLQDKAAQFGVRSGVPMSGLSRSRNLRDLGLSSEQLQSQGLRDYGGLVGAVSRTQTVDPSLQAQIAAHNANIKSAPIPSYAQSYAQNLYDRYLNNMRGPGGGGRSYFGPASGTGELGDTALGFGASQQYPTAGPIGTEADPFAYAWQSSRPYGDKYGYADEYFPGLDSSDYGYADEFFPGLDQGYSEYANPFPGFLPPDNSLPPEDDWMLGG